MLNDGDGDDLLVGGLGNDSYIVHDAGDRIVERAHEGTDRAAAGASYVLTAGAEVEVLTTTSWGGTAAIDLTGNGYGQTITGNAGANVLATGGGAADVLRGGPGDDLYRVYNAADRLIELAGEGSDRVNAAVDYGLAEDADIEVLATNGASGTAAIDLTGNRLAQTILGNAGANVLSDGGGAADVLAGYGGDDTYIVRAAGTRVVELAGGGHDRVAAALDFALDAAAEIELLTTTSAAGSAAIALTGNGYGQEIQGNAGANTLSDGGGEGADLLVGRRGDDLYIVRAAGTGIVEAAHEGSDRVAAAVSFTLTAGAEVEVLTTTSWGGTAAIDLTGNGYGQTITGNAGANVLATGGGAADVLRGGPGDDLYRVYNAADRLIELAGEGSDRVNAAVDYGLAEDADIEVLATNGASGTAAIDLTGNRLAQTILGNAGANVLSDGGGAADVLAGYGGDDTYIVRAAGTRVVELAGGGHDRVAAALDFALDAAAEIELLTTTSAAGSAAIALTGNGYGQEIQGNAGANTLSDGGGEGADLLVGRRGDDLYIVRAAGTGIVEAAHEGSDRVAAAVSFTLTAGAEVEVLTTTSWGGTAAIDLTGNGYGQTITGNAGANVLATGGGAADVLRGGPGDDLYRVYNAADRLIELAGEGSDRVNAAVDYGLAEDADIEVLATNGASGTAAIDLTGNRLAQTILGNAGANVLSDGGGAADVLAGYGGDDTYIVRAAGTRVVELAGGGHDRVAAALDFALDAAAEIELLTTTSAAGSAAIALTGNGYGQEIQGNAGANRIDGGGGRDLLTGGAGADQFVFTSALGAENFARITDFDPRYDHIRLDGDIFAGTNHGTLGAGYFHASTSGQAQDASDRILYDTDSGYLYYDPDGTGGAGRAYFARLDPGLALHADDFVVF